MQRFLRQSNSAHRDMHIVLGALGLHFLIASMTYFFAPLAAIAQFRGLGALFDQVYMVSEFSHVWRVLAAGNVFVLAMLCFAIQANPIRFAPYVPVFLVLKLFSAFGFLFVWLAGRFAPWSMLGVAYAPLLGVVLWDSLNAWMVWFFARRARRAIAAAGPDATSELVPRLFFVEAD